MPAKEYIYRHKTVSRFQLTGHPGEAPFDFKNGLMRITSEDRNNRFLDLHSKLHPRDKMQIVEVNSEAAAKLERAIGPRVSREALDTSQIRSGVKGADGSQQMTQAQIEELAEQQRLNDEQAKDTAQQALDEAARLIAAGATQGSEDDAEKERLARVAAEEGKAAEAGAIDQTENQPEPEQEKSAPVAGLQTIKKTK